MSVLSHEYFYGTGHPSSLLSAHGHHKWCHVVITGQKTRYRLPVAVVMSPPIAHFVNTHTHTHTHTAKRTNCQCFVSINLSDRSLLPLVETAVVHRLQTSPGMFFCDVWYTEGCCCIQPINRPVVHETTQFAVCFEWLISISVFTYIMSYYDSNFMYN